jgi:hypothetical protein
MRRLDPIIIAAIITAIGSIIAAAIAAIAFFAA